MSFESLVDAFAKSVEVNSVNRCEEDVLSVNVGEFELFFSYLKVNQAVMLHASLAEHDNKKETLAYLLEMNTFFAKFQGLCLGIDDNIITVQQNIYIGAGEHKTIEPEIFLKQCETFLIGVSILVSYFNDTARFAQDVADAQKNKMAKKETPPVMGQSIRC